MSHVIIKQMSANYHVVMPSDTDTEEVGCATSACTYLSLSR